MLESTKDDLMVGAASLLLSGAVAAGAGVTALFFGLGCGLSESGAGLHPPCIGPWLYAPLIAVGLAPGAWVAMALTRSARVYWWGTAAAVVLGGCLWLLWGDPAGNFGGLLPWG